MGEARSATSYAVSHLAEEETISRRYSIGNFGS